MIEFSRVVAIAEGGGYYPGAMHPVALWALMDTVFRRIRSCSLRLMLVAVLGAAVVAGCGTQLNQLEQPPAPAQPSGPVLAYRASSEIGLVDGTAVAATAPGSFTPSSERLVTDDGRFVFAHGADGNAVALEVATKTTSVVPIPQGSRLGTGGGSTIVWLEQPNRLMQFDLANPGSGPTLRQEVDLPTVYGLSAPPEPVLLTAREGTTIIARVESTPSPFGGPDTLYAVRGNTAPTALGLVDANTPVSVADLSPDGASLAYAVYRRSSNSCGTAAVVVANADGKQQTFDVAAPDSDTGSQVLRLWWPESGPMSLSLATWRCDQPGPSSPRVWELSGDQLRQATPPTVALQAAVVTPGQRALIVPQGNTPPDASGTLVVEDSGRRIPIKSGVDAIDVIRGPVAAP